MARKAKNGNRAKGIEARKGNLYIVYTQRTEENGEKKAKRKWIATGLENTLENVKKAVELRNKLIFGESALPLPELHIAPISSLSGQFLISLRQYMKECLVKKERGIAETTIAQYENCSKRINKYLGDMNISDITRKDVEDFLDNLACNGLEERTIRDSRNFLKMILKEACMDGIIKANPAENVKINKKLIKATNKKNEDDKFFSYSEACHFLDVVQNHPMYNIFYFSLFFGLRREEVLGLRWKAINFEKKTMIINHILVKADKVYMLDRVKTQSSIRSYPLTDDQIEILKAVKREEEKNRAFFGNTYEDNQYIFKKADGSLYHPDTITRNFRKIIVNHPELPQDITFHGLRSSCVSILVYIGMNIKAIQKWVGHKEIETTLKIYARVKDKEAKEEVSKKMSNILDQRLPDIRSINTDELYSGSEYDLEIE